MWLAWVEQYQNTSSWQAASPYIMCRRIEGDKPYVPEWPLCEQRLLFGKEKYLPFL